MSRRCTWTTWYSLPGLSSDSPAWRWPPFTQTEVKNPQRDYPKAILISALIILSIFVIGSLAISIVVPANQINIEGRLDAGLPALLRCRSVSAVSSLWLALLVAVGAVAPAQALWVAGPSKGLLATAKNGDLPPVFQFVNRNGMPSHILIIQAVLASLLAMRDATDAKRWKGPTGC